MNRVNLLSEHLRRVAANRIVRQRWTAISVIALLLVAVWGFVALLQFYHLDRRIDLLKREVAPIRRTIVEVNQLRRDHQRLNHELAVLDTMRSPASGAEILALLSHLMPTDTVANRIVMVFPPLVLDSNTERVRKHQKIQDVYNIKVELEGIAASADMMSVLQDQLHESNMISDVRLVRNWDVIDEGKSRQAYHIVMKLPLVEDISPKRDQ